MKYIPENIIVPFEKREVINKKILTIIQSSQPDKIAKDDVFNCFTGLGKLHGLSRSDYENYHDFSEAKKIEELGQFFTPTELCQQIIDVLEIGEQDTVCDLSCGSGNFINAAPNEANFYACELEPKAFKVAKYLYPDAKIELKDMQYYQPEVFFDWVVGNPPFNFKMKHKGKEITSQLFYCIKAAQHLKPAGILALIVPSSFLNDEFFCKSEIKSIDEEFNFICQKQLPSNSFKAVGIEKFDTKLMIFQKRSQHIEHKPYTVQYEEGSLEEIKERILKPVLQEKENLKAKFILEFNRHNTEDFDYAYHFKKLLFEIKTHPAINRYYQKAYSHVHKLKTQEKPEDMAEKEWADKKLTPAKVLSYLRRIVKKQNSKEDDIVRLVKQQYGFKLKAYSRKKKLEMSKMGLKTYWPFYDLVANEEEMPRQYQELPEVKKVLAKRRKSFQIQSQPFVDMKRNASLDKALSSFVFQGRGNKPANFNETQIHDLGLIFQKPYAQLNWEMGAGKTPSGYSWGIFRRDACRSKNIFICSAAIAIHMTWEPFMIQHQESFIKIKDRADFDKIKEGDFILLTSDMTIKYRRDIKKHLKKIGRKAALIFDESDEITNHATQINKSMQDCFSKLPYKINTTGTSTRNSIVELFPQLRLLYNNSANLMCTAPLIYKEKREDGEVSTKIEDNEFYNKPFPAKGGHEVFKGCFCPTKSTVFGIEKQNQDILQAEDLKPLISKTIITRRFKEIAGEKYKIVSHRINQNQYEEDVYKVVLSEFGQIMNQYFKSTGNSRKDSMLRIIRQIQLLIKACSVPHLFKEYGDKTVLPNKFERLLEMIKQNDGKCMVGCTTKEEAKAYYTYLTEAFPFKPIYHITGSTSFKKRLQIRDQFDREPEAIIVSTQQALSSSVSFRTVKHIYLTALQWNVAKMSQYYFRGIRFDSENQVKVHMITYNRTIEQNILALLMAKERLNEFIKTLEVGDREDVFGEFGVDLSLLNGLITKNYDQDGNMYLSWGSQQVAA